MEFKQESFEKFYDIGDELGRLVLFISFKMCSTRISVTVHYDRLFRSNNLDSFLRNIIC